MAVLGLLLFAAAAGLTVDVLSQNTTTMHVHAVGQTYAMSHGGVFLAGVVTAVAGLCGFWLFASGMARSRRRRAMLRETQGTTEELKAERDRLATALVAERAARLRDGRDAPTPHAGQSPVAAS
jgi:hypothetical protein